MTKAMTFPIEADIVPVGLANVLRVEGAFAVPPTFTYVLLRRSGASDTVLGTGSVPMTADQWSEWADQNDADYILECVSSNLNLVIA